MTQIVQTESMLERYALAADRTYSRQISLMRNRLVEPFWAPDSSSLRWKRQEGDVVEQVQLDLATMARTPFVEEGAVAAPSVPFGVLAAPGGKQGVVVRDHDLWLVDLVDGGEVRLTHDGEPGHTWGVLSDASNINIPLKRLGVRLPPGFAYFSPSGRYLLVARVDERSVEELILLETVPVDRARPRPWSVRTVYGDEQRMPAPELAVIDLTTHQLTSLPVEDGQLGCLLLNGGAVISWSEDQATAWLFAHSMGMSEGCILELDLATGTTKKVYAETDETGYEPNTFLYSLPCVRVLPETREAVWFSQREGIGRLYLVDLTSGDTKHPISSDDVVVWSLLRVDQDRREVLFLGGTERDGQNPYLRKLYRASLDAGDQQLLTPEPVDHEIAEPPPAFYSMVFAQGRVPASAVSPDGRWCVDHMSTVDKPPTIVLRDLQQGGRVVCILEETDVTALLADGYQPPHPFSFTTEDGLATCHGIAHIPAGATADAPVPLVDLIYAGFQTTYTPMAWLGGGGVVGKASSAMYELDALGIASFIMDGRGTPGRESTFRRWTQRSTDPTRGLGDHAEGVRALCRQHPELDAGRVGITGHSFGGYNSARALMLFPETFHAAVSSAGGHVPEKTTLGGWSWLFGNDAAPNSPELQSLSNLPLVSKLRGALLLQQGELDENCTPDHTMALVKALMAAGKRFDLKLWPSANHYQSSAYTTMTAWDHWTRHLLGQEPPADFVPDPLVRVDASGLS